MFKALYQVVGGFFTHALDTRDRFGLERIQVGDVLDHAKLIELLNKLVTDALDIHRTTRYKMLDCLSPLRRTIESTGTA